MIKIELKIPYSEIQNLQYKNKNKVIRLVINLNNGDKLTLYGDQARKVFDKLRRNKAGEHLD